MIEYHYELEVELEEAKYSDWLTRVCKGGEGAVLGNLNFVFCGDEFLLDINQRYLNHDTYTDIITFDYTQGRVIGGDVFISVDRVQENALKYEVDFYIELQRVMVHGLLHLLGFKDKSENDSKVMRLKEDEKIRMFHVEH